MGSWLVGWFRFVSFRFVWFGLVVCWFGLFVGLFGWTLDTLISLTPVLIGDLLPAASKQQQ